MTSLEPETVVLRPFLHHLIDHVLRLRVVRATEQVHHLLQLVDGLLVRHRPLEDANSGATLPLPELGIGVQSLEHVESLASVVKLPHLVAVVGDEVEKVEGLVARVHPHVSLPRKRRLIAHDIAPRQPTEVAEFSTVLLVLDLQQPLLGLLVVPGGRACNPVVPIKVIVIREVRLDGLQVHEHVIELFQQEEAGSHALSPRNGIALRGRSTHELKELLRQLQVLFGASALAQGREHDTLEDVLAGHCGLKVLDEVVGLQCLVSAQVVDHQV
mmetsp:Transcript_42623/g.90789  ORF Transcript_42623/g.90789 Transcript_42623/m.90789 type:complete len:271 (+) Transcript_42623:75-887(+)